MLKKNKSLRICVYNLQNLFIFLRPDFNFHENLNEDQWQAKKSSLNPNKQLRKLFKLKTVFEDIDADVWLLTEVGGRESIKNFNTLFLEKKYLIYHMPSNSDRGIDLCYLVKKSLPHEAELNTNITHQLNFKYDDSNKNELLSRDVLELDLTLNNDIKINFFLVHLKSLLDKNYKDYLGFKRRKAEVELLVKLYLAKRNPGIPLLIGGDFNSIAGRQDTTQEFIPIYKKTDLEDVLQLRGIPKNERYTHIHFSPGNRAIFHQLDYLFIDKKYQPCLQEAQVYRYKSQAQKELPPPSRHYERFSLPSDHYPVYANLDINDLGRN